MSGKRMESKSTKDEARNLFLGMAVIMYMGSAYDYFYGFSGPGRGGFGVLLIRLLETFLGSKALGIVFFCFGTFFVFLAIVNRGE